jgi:long-chain acyl-CoA synthetase
MHFEPQFRTLVEVLERSAKANSGRPLFGTKKAGQWSWMTYAEFAREVERLRAGLASRGVVRGDRVAIIANNRVEWAAAAYATYGLGAAFVPMYEAQHAKEWEFIVRDCGAKVLFVANEAVLAKAKPSFERLPALKQVVLIEGHTNGGDGKAAASPQVPVETYASLVVATNGGVETQPVQPTDTAGLIYTSGTTGEPKGVVLTHLNLASNVSCVHYLFPVGPDDRSLAFLPWAHVFGQVVELHFMISLGASIAICESVDKLLDNLAEVKPTILMSVPRIFNRLYTAVHTQIASKPRPIQALVNKALVVTAKERRGQRLDLRELALLKLADRLVFSKVRARFGGRLKYAVSGGAALSTSVAEFIDSIGVTVYEGYGLTETSPIATANQPGARKIGSVGRAVPGVRVEIDEATGENRPADGSKPARFEGEIVVYGHNVMKGYFNRPEETAKVFTKDGGFRTGDMGYVDTQGYVFLTGRIKEQYKLENGRYVVPTPLEDKLKLSQYVLNAMVYGANRPYNVAIVVANVSAVRKWAEQHSIAVSADVDALLRDERVKALFRKEIAEQSGDFKGYESVQDFALIANDFTTDNGMLTPKLSLRRRQVVEAYQPLIEQLYAKKKGEIRAGTSAVSS